MQITSQPGVLLCSGKRKRAATAGGFTLIEIMIAVAVIGILAAIAVPGYGVYVTKANRTDAMNFLSEVAGEQQRYFSENNVYARQMSELGYGTGATANSPENLYTVSITTPDNPTSYLLTATPLAGSRQAQDAQCRNFTLSSTGARANTGGTDDNCW